MGLRRACDKRPVSVDALERLVDRVEKEFADSTEREVASAQIGERVMVGLRELDQVAYVRFASVYRSFRDIQEFMDELTQLLGRAPRGGP